MGGSDVIYVAAAGTFINEPNANNAQVISSVDFSLYDGSYNNIHKLTLTGPATTTPARRWDSVLLTENAHNSTNGRLSNATSNGAARNRESTAAYRSPHKPT